MKKILIILITIPLIFGSCEKEDDSPNSNSNNGIPLVNLSLGLIGYGTDSYNVFKTTNGGVSWTNVSTQNIDEIDFISENIGYGTDS